MKGGDNIFGAIQKGINKTRNFTQILYEKGIFLYIVLIIVGILIYKILQFFIGIKLGREALLKKVQDRRIQ